MTGDRIEAEKSPWLEYASRLRGDTFAATGLQQLTLSLFDGRQWPIDLSNIVFSLEDTDFEVAMAMIKWYRRFGETCPVFMDAGLSIAKQRLKESW